MLTSQPSAVIKLVSNYLVGNTVEEERLKNQH